MEAIIKAPWVVPSLNDIIEDLTRLFATVYTQDGEELVSDYTTGDAAAPANWYIDQGTGVTPADKADSGLELPASEARVIGATTQPSADIVQWIGTITSDGTKTISEAGVFDAITGGNMLIHSVFTGIAVLLGDKIEFTFTLEQT